MGQSKHRYLRFLITLLLLVLIQPLVTTPEPGTGLTLAQVARSVFLTGILVVGMLASCTSRQNVVVGLTLAMLTLGAAWVLPIIDTDDHSWAESDLGLILAACPALFFFYTAGLTLKFVLRGAHVTLERIFAALCVYLLIGFAFSMIYFFIFEIDPPGILEIEQPGVILEIDQPGSILDPDQPGAFRLPEETLRLEGLDGIAWRDFVFFSFVTMTTLGYGDFVPINQWARSMTILQSIFAVLYLAVLVAALVGGYQRATLADGDPDPDDG